MSESWWKEAVIYQVRTRKVSYVSQPFQASDPKQRSRSTPRLSKIAATEAGVISRASSPKSTTSRSWAQTSYGYLQVCLRTFYQWLFPFFLCSKWLLFFRRITVMVIVLVSRLTSYQFTSVQVAPCRYGIRYIRLQDNRPALRDQ